MRRESNGHYTLYIQKSYESLLKGSILLFFFLKKVAISTQIK